MERHISKSWQIGIGSMIFGTIIALAVGGWILQTFHVDDYWVNFVHRTFQAMK